MKPKTFTHRLVDLPDLPVSQTEEGRFYITPQGHSYHSVTTFLSHFKGDSLKKWEERVGKEEADKIRQQAADRGTMVHALCEAYVRNQPIIWEGETLKHKGAFSQFSWILNGVDDIRAIETALYSDNLQLAGRVDLIGTYKGLPSIIDFKTSRRLKRKEDIVNYFVQTTAYSIMFEELTGERYENLVILMHGDKGNQVFVEHRSAYIPVLNNYIKKFRKDLQAKINTSNALFE